MDLKLLYRYMIRVGMAKGGIVFNRLKVINGAPGSAELWKSIALMLVCYWNLSQ